MFSTMQCLKKLKKHLPDGSLSFFGARLFDFKILGFIDFRMLIFPILEILVILEIVPHNQTTILLSRDDRESIIERGCYASGENTRKFVSRV